RRTDGRSAVAGAVAGVLANLALAAWTPGVSWLWWNVAGFAVTLAVALLFGRGERPAGPAVSGGHRQAWLLVAFFALILTVLALVTAMV
ncbi:MAG TPA: hypothetical protein VLT81_16340, partial [Chondromyces sp.]|nr:hypothetical protein [Chondromyces sp.]